MSTAKSIPGIQRGPDFERETHEASRVDQVTKAAKLERPPEINDPVVSAALDAVNEISDSIGRKVDVQYDTSTGQVVMTVLSSDGEEVIRRLPPEEAIRMAQRLKDERSRFMDNTF
ncbi:MAG: flagellar protein FlaG [Deltaproteobacteria bacterium]|nr:flagellar protein FlaG [Deltaproteobacteria bacterium]